MSLRRAVCGSLISLVAILYSLCAQAVERAPLTVLSSPLPVFSEQMADGSLSGYSISLVKGILAHAHIEGDYRGVPFARMVATLENDSNTLATGIARTPERENAFYWITPITANPIALYVKKSSPLASKDPVTINDLSSVSVVRRDYREGILNQQHVVNVMSVNNWTQAVEAVLKERVEGVFYSQMGVALTCQQAQLDCSDLVQVLVWETAYSYVVLPKTPENSDLAARLTIAASEFKASDGFAKLIDGTLPKFQRYLVSTQMSEGVISFIGKQLNAKSDDLWIIADLVPGFSELNERGEVVGYAAELVKEILFAAGINKKILAAPWERIMREASAKSNVLAFAVARTPEREDLFHWITPITRNMHGLYGLNDKTFTALSDLPLQSRIAVLRKDYRGQVAREAGLQTLAFDSWPAALAAVLSGEADYLFASDGALELGCSSLKVSCDNIRLSMNYKIITTYLVLSKQGTDPALVELLKNAAVRVKQSEQYQHWSQAWSEDAQKRYNLTQHIENGVVNLWNASRH